MGRHHLKKLGKLIEYILLRRPDEFGLFLNDDGSLPIKELLWALHEEAGWKHVRSGHLKELSLSGLQLAFMVEESLIRPKQVPSKGAPNTVPPRLLYFAAKRKAYPVILKHGLSPGGRPYVPLATKEEMALRIGKRRDPKPILLTVHATKAHDSGLEFLKSGELLYLVETLSTTFLSGPPLRETPQPRKVFRPLPTEAQEPEIPQMMGSFLLDPDSDPDLMRRQRRKQKKDRKRQISQERRRKRRRSGLSQAGRNHLRNLPTMTFGKPFNRGSRYFYLLIAATCILFSSCSSRYLLKAPHRIENYELNFTERGIEPFDKANISQQEWWESFYQHIVHIEASDIGHYLQFEHDTELNSLVALIAARGEQFYTDQFGIVAYLVLGNNSRRIADVSYFRIADAQSLAAYKRLELLLEKGVEVPWKNIPEKLKRDNTSETGARDQSTPWILYRFRISKLIDDQRGLFNRAFLLSCDRYYCLTGIDGTRRVALAKGKRRYSDLVIPESKGYTIIEKIFKKAVEEYCANYKCLK